MFITWLGHSCFKIQNKGLTIITDPYGPALGLRPIKAKADIVTASHTHPDHNYLKGIMGEPFVVNDVGEYETRGVYIVGLASAQPKEPEAAGKRNIIFRFFLEGIVLVHPGDLGHLLSEEVIDALGDVDVLFVPAGDQGTLPVDKIPELIGQIEPRIVIPMHYKIPGVRDALASVSRFCEEMGVPSMQESDRLKITKKDLEGDETEVKILSKH